MRRAFAMLLVGMFSFSLISPAVFAEHADAKLPACCRRDGKHHCAMPAGAASPSGQTLQADKCRFYPCATTIPPGQTVSLPPVAQVIVAGLLTHPASCPTAETLCRISFSRAGQKRGPPAPLS